MKLSTALRARGAYDAAVTMYRGEVIELRRGRTHWSSRVQLLA